MTNPYGTEPGRPPQGLGDPGSQGPQFVAPGGYGPGGGFGQPGQYGQPGPYAPGPYAPPGQYGQPGQYGPPSPYGQQPSQPYATGPQGPQPYPPLPQQAPGYGPQQPFGASFPPGRPPRTRRSSAPLVVVVVLAILAAVVGGGYELYRLATPQPVTQPTPIHPTRAASIPSVSRASAGASATSATDCVSGDRITTTAFVATVPANWSCDGDDGDVSIASTRSDAIWVEHDASSGDLTADCKAQLEGLGEVSPLPQETWGGKTALAFQALDNGDIFGVRCVVVGSQAWYLMYFPLEAKDDATVRADVTSLLSTWVWR